MRFVKDVANHFSNDFKNNRELFFIELGGTLCILLPSIMLSIFDIPLLVFYSVMSVGSVLNLIAGNKRQSGFLVLINGSFLIINLVGIGLRL